jgi:hypothetical protein
MYWEGELCIIPKPLLFTAAQEISFFSYNIYLTFLLLIVYMSLLWIYYLIPESAVSITYGNTGVCILEGMGWWLQSTTIFVFNTNFLHVNSKYNII